MIKIKLEIITKDITKLKVDVIVNAANNSLLGGGGVDGAIHSAAGPRLIKACKEIRKKKYLNGLPTGKAIITPGFDLPSKYVIHTIGPIYNKDCNPKEMLSLAYKNSLDIAEKNKIKSIAFPAISTGVYKYPKKEAIEVVRKVMNSYKFRSINNVILCFHSERDANLAKKVFKR